MLVAGAAIAVLLPASVAQADPTPTQIAAQIKDSNDQLEVIVESFDKINGDLATTQAALNALQTKMGPLQASVDSTAASVNQIAVAAYVGESGGLRNISILLNATSSDDALNKITMLDQLSQAQAHELGDYRAQKAGFDTEKNRLTQLLAQQNAQKAALAAKQAQIQGDLNKLNALISKAKAAGVDTSGGPAKSLGPLPPVSGKAGIAVQYAYNHAQPGKHYMYKYATDGPTTYDCSGLTLAAWRAAGVSLPHNAAEQWGKTRHILRSQLQPGDLVFYNGLAHVGIYVGNGTVIHAPHPGTWVQAAGINLDPIYGYGRVVT